MRELDALLDTIKERRSLSSDAALARLLDCSRQALSSYRNGARYPDAVLAARIADLAGVPVTRVLGMVGEARAVSSAEKAVWRRVASAAALVLAVVASADQELGAAAVRIMYKLMRKPALS